MSVLFYVIVTTSLLGRTLLAEMLVWRVFQCNYYPMGCDLSDSLYSSYRCFPRISLLVFLPSVILPFLRFVPLVVVVVPFRVFSLSEMLIALLISSFYDWFQQFPVLFDWFQHFPVLFNWFQQFPVLFDWFQHFPVLFDWFYYYPVF